MIIIQYNVYNKHKEKVMDWELMCLLGPGSRKLVFRLKNTVEGFTK